MLCLFCFGLFFYFSFFFYKTFCRYSHVALPATRFSFNLLWLWWKTTTFYYKAIRIFYFIPKTICSLRCKTPVQQSGHYELPGISLSFYSSSWRFAWGFRPSDPPGAATPQRRREWPRSEPGSCLCHTLQRNVLFFTETSDEKKNIIVFTCFPPLNKIKEEKYICSVKVDFLSYPGIL